MPQFLDPTTTLITTTLHHNTVHIFNQAFSGRLCFFTHRRTGVVFLADTGSVPNLIKRETVASYWPSSYQNRTPFQMPIKGVGGGQTLDAICYVTFSNQKIPFCMGKYMTFNIIGIDYIPFILNLYDEFELTYQRPSESSSLTALNGRDLITLPHGVSIDETYSSALALPARTGKSDAEEEKRSRERHSYTVKPGVNRKPEEVETERAPPDIPNNSSKKEEGEGIPTVTDIETKARENPERYLFVIDPELDPEKAKKLQEALVKRKVQVERESTLKEPQVDLHSLENTVIPQQKWYPIYEPFHEELTDLEGHLKGNQYLPFECTVKLINPNVTPHVSPPYAINHPEQKKALEDNIEKYLKMGIIEHGPSEWKTSLFVVPQKVNEEQKRLKTYHPSQHWRVVQDFTPLNAKVQKVENVLPLIPDIFKIAADKEIFSLLDLSKAFFHCMVKEEDRKYFGISHRSMKLRMRRMPMGFLNSPSIWQKNMTAAIWIPVQKAFHLRFPLEAELLHIAVYMDDIFLATKTEEQHLFLLQILFKQLAKFKLTLSIGKSFIGKRSVFLLGEQILPHQRKIQAQRLRALSLLAPPQTVFQVRAFLGALRYIADHIPRLNEQLHPFDAYTGKVPAKIAPMEYIHWTYALLDTYDHIKVILSNPSVLSHFTPRRHLYLETDASNEGYGSFLFQTDEELAEGTLRYPLAYSSQAWKTPTERAAHPCRKELNASKRVIEKYQYLLQIYPFTIITDNMGVYHLVKNFAKGKPPRDLILVRYLQTICIYPILGIIHKGSSQVFTSDALSRMAWLDMAVEESDPLAWPAMFVTPSLTNAIARQIIRHMRHTKCTYQKDGKHHISKCLRPLCQGLSNQQFALLIEELKKESRLFLHGDKISAKYGHSRGIDQVPPDLYDGPTLDLYHVTTEAALPSIKLRGLSPMTRWYIHFTSIPPPQIYDSHPYQRALKKEFLKS